MPAKKDTRNTLSPAKVEQIVELRLAGVPVREVAKRVGTTTRTVQNHWHKWLKATATDRADALEEAREEIVQRLSQLADDARRAFTVALNSGDNQAAARWADQERQALKELARIQGLDVANINLSGGTDNTVAFVWRDEVVRGGE